MLATWQVRGGRPTGEDETIALEPDGTAWLWVRVPADRERDDVVGSFRATVDRATVQRVREVLERLAGESGASPDGHRGTVTITTGGGTRSLPLHGGAAGAAADAMRLARELAAAAFEEPLAAIRFSARFRPALDLSALAGIDESLLPDVLKASPAGPSALVGLVAEGIGRQPTTIILAADRLQAHWRSGDRPLGWTELPAPDVGLGVAGVGDGIRVPADVRPGESAALSVRADLPDEPADGVVIQVSGRIGLVGPWESLGVPDAPFEARTRPASLGPSLT
jgi:hypothetical protein